MRRLKLFAITLILVIGVLSVVEGQNIAITDDNAYTAHSSAMLDVKSLTRGFLVPRMTSVQRDAIVLPATGLLVFDTNENVYYYYTGSTWSNLSVGQLWTKNGNYVYLSNTDDNVGIGITAPENKLLVKADATTGIDESIFAVLNNAGDTVFAVYQEGVRIWVNDAGGAKANGSRGGFAVGGFNPAKAGVTNEYLRVTPDSVRVYINDDFNPAKATGSRGGFAVGGYNPAKGTTTDNYLFIQDDSTRIYTGDTVSGFGVENLGVGTSTSYMRLTPNNYFIGHQAGDSITSGLYNSFFGYKSGISNKSGNFNVFTGYESGYLNDGGEFNTFMGYKSGKMNTSSDNTFIGFEAGSAHESGGGNVFIGSKAGQLDISGSQNIFIGENSGVNNVNGSQNIFMGFSSGCSNSSGDYNVMIGTMSGYSNTAGFVNNFIGQEAGYSNTEGTNNVFVGYQCGYNNLTASGNIFMGRQTGFNNTIGTGNLYLGNHAGFMNNVGNSNVFLGISSGMNSLGEENVYVGAESNLNNTNGIRNVSIGTYAGYWSTGSGSVFIGYQAGYDELGPNKLYIENSSNSISPLINGDFMANRLAINRQADTYPFQVGTDASNGNEAFLTDGGTWTNTSSKTLKDRFIELNESDVLSKIENLDIKGWFYKETQEYHISPFAEDFFQAFGTGVLNEPVYLGKSLAASDIAGISLFAVKELIRQNKELFSRNNDLQGQIDSLKAEMEEIKQMVNASAKK